MRLSRYRLQLESSAIDRRHHLDMRQSAVTSQVSESLRRCQKKMLRAPAWDCPLAGPSSNRMRPFGGRRTLRSGRNLSVHVAERGSRASGCVANPENSKISFSDEELFPFTQTANVLHQSVDLALKILIPRAHPGIGDGFHNGSLRIYSGKIRRKKAQVFQGLKFAAELSIFAGFRNGI